MENSNDPKTAVVRMYLDVDFKLLHETDGLTTKNM